MQKHLLYITKLTVKDIPDISKVRGVLAIWNELENTVYVTFYYNGEITEDELEDYSIACSEIIAHCSNAILEGKFIRLDYPNLLPQSEFWAFKTSYSK